MTQHRKTKKPAPRHKTKTTRRPAAIDATSESTEKCERIQKVLAAAGFGSRRSCEELVLDGLVTVNGKRRTELPVIVDPAHDDIRVDGQPVRAQQHVYYMLHKPKNVLSTNRDPQGRRRAIDLLTGVKERVFPVGRLDADSTGLLLLTNDGDLAERLTHPRYGVEKTYDVEVSGRMTTEDFEKLQKGVWISGGKTMPAKIRVVHRGSKVTHLQLTLREGRNREVRRMLVRLGHNVRKLKRVKMGPLVLRGVGPGRFRALTSVELSKLRRAVAGGEAAAAAAPARPKRPARASRKKAGRRGPRGPRRP